MNEKHVLVVEDDEIMLQGIIDLLTISGYRVDEAPDGIHALEHLRRMDHLPDVIVSDISMPLMDGYSLLESVRSNPDWMSVPFIFLTAKGEKTDIRAGKSRGVDDYITKPFEFEDLLVSIENVIDRRKTFSAVQETRMDMLRQHILRVLHHEFRTPLTYIVAYADLLQQTHKTSESEELREYVNGITTGANRLSRLINDFLVLAELETGYATNVFDQRAEKIDNEAYPVLWQDAVKFVVAMADRHQVALEFDIPTKLPAIYGDPTYLAAMIGHLLSNGIKFSSELAPEDKVVRMVVAQDNDYLIMRVIDHGTGIPKHEIENIFDTFYQIDREHLEQQGTGAGLAIVRHVAQIHGGTASVQSEEGKGTTFEVRLPVL